MNNKYKRMGLSLFGDKAKSFFYLSKKIINYPINLQRKICKNISWKFKANKLIDKIGYLQLHLGCGDRHFGGMLNCEYRATRAADIVMDCGNLQKFKNNSIRLIFSHAFIEHLYRKQQQPFLNECHRVLEEGGILIFLGIPDFQVIVQNYINQSSVMIGTNNIFNLYHVYRYTHGDPEIAPGYWQEQLHKSLFDKEYLKRILKKANFSNSFFFNYAYPGEVIELNLGVITWKDKKPNSQIIMDHMRNFKEYIGDFQKFESDFISKN